MPDSQELQLQQKREVEKKPRGLPLDACSYR
jgi:hypothetical protein